MTHKYMLYFSLYSPSMLRVSVCMKPASHCLIISLTGRMENRPVGGVNRTTVCDFEELVIIGLTCRMENRSVCDFGELG